MVYTLGTLLFLFPPILSYGILSEKEKIDNADPQNLLLFLIGINKKLLVIRIQLTNDYNLWIYHQMVKRSIIGKEISITQFTIA